MSVVQLLAQKNFITYSKVIAKLYGVNAAILLGAMCGYQSCHNDEEFCKTQDEISDDTCLGIYEIKEGLKTLKAVGILRVTRKGMPAQNYYYVTANKLAEILLTSEVKITQQDVENSDNNTSINTNIINTKKIEKKNNNKRATVGESTVESIIEMQDERLQEPLRNFVEMRKAIKRPITARGLELAVKKLQQMTSNIAEQVDIVNQSTMNSWQGFFPLKRLDERQKHAPKGSTQELLDKMTDEQRFSMGITV